MKKDLWWQVINTEIAENRMDTTVINSPTVILLSRVKGLFIIYFQAIIYFLNQL